MLPSSLKFSTYMAGALPSLKSSTYMAGTLPKIDPLSIDIICCILKNINLFFVSILLTISSTLSHLFKKNNVLTIPVPLTPVLDHNIHLDILSPYALLLSLKTKSYLHCHEILIQGKTMISSIHFETASTYP